MFRKRRLKPRGRGRPIRQGSLLGKLRMWMRRFAVAIMVLLAGSLIAIDRFETPAIREFRAGVSDFFAPLVATVSAPFHAAVDWFDAFESNATVRERNAELEREIERLRLSLHDMAAVEEENRRLRALVNAGNRIKGRHLTAAVFADTGGPYVRSLLVGAGAADGLRRGMAVINADGLIGRIVEVGRHTSRVLLVTDLNSRIPVQLAGSGLRALLAGTNGRRMRLNYVPPNVSVSLGTLIVTSGHGAVLPRGLPVGRVDSVGRDAILVRPLVNWNRLAYVRIVDFRTLGLVQDSPDDLRQQEADRRAEPP